MGRKNQLKTIHLEKLYKTMSALIKTGTIDRIFPTNVISDEMQYRTFWVVGDDGEFARFQMVGPACNLLDNVAINTRVSVGFRIKGKPKGDTLYMNLNVTKFDLLE
jgi:hypothetical protein